MALRYTLALLSVLLAVAVAVALVDVPPVAGQSTAERYQLSAPFTGNFEYSGDNAASVTCNLVSGVVSCNHTGGGQWLSGYAHSQVITSSFPFVTDCTTQADSRCGFRFDFTYSHNNKAFRVGGAAPTYSTLMVTNQPVPDNTISARVCVAASTGNRNNINYDGTCDILYDFSTSAGAMPALGADSIATGILVWSAPQTETWTLSNPHYVVYGVPPAPPGNTGHPSGWWCIPESGPYQGQTFSANLLQNYDFDTDGLGNVAPNDVYFLPPKFWIQNGDGDYNDIWVRDSYAFATPSDWATGGRYSIWVPSTWQGEYRLFQDAYIPWGSGSQKVMMGGDARLGPNHTGNPVQLRMSFGSWMFTDYPEVSTQAFETYTATRSLVGGREARIMFFGATGREVFFDRAFLIAFEDEDMQVIWCPSPDKYPEATQTPTATPWPGTATPTVTATPDVYPTATVFGGVVFSTPTIGPWSTPVDIGIGLTPQATTCPVYISERTVYSPAWLDYFVDSIEFPIDGISLCIAPQDLNIGSDNPAQQMAGLGNITIISWLSTMLSAAVGVTIFIWFKRR
jgi:hypothetical protein